LAIHPKALVIGSMPPRARAKQSNTARIFSISLLLLLLLLLLLVFQ